jgi:hypothetical protein
MENYSCCECNFYNIKFFRFKYPKFYIESTLCFFLRSLRKIGKENRYPKKFFSYRDNFISQYHIKEFRDTKKNSKIQTRGKFLYKSGFLKQILFDNYNEINKKVYQFKNFFLSGKNNSFENFFLLNLMRKLLSIIKPFFGDNCLKIKNALLQLFCLFSNKVNLLKLVFMSNSLSCKNDTIFQKNFLKFLFSNYKVQNFTCLFPYIRSLIWKKKDHLSMEFFFFILKLIVKKKFKLFSFEIYEIFLITKRVSGFIYSRFSDLIFLISKYLFYFGKAELVPELQDLKYLLFNSLKKEKFSCFIGLPESIDFFLKNLKLHNNPEMITCTFYFIKNIFESKVFSRKKIFIFIMNCIKENIFEKKTIFAFFTSNKKINKNFLNMVTCYRKKLFILLFKKFLIISKKIKFENLLKGILHEKDSIKISTINLILRQPEISFSSFSEKIILEIFTVIFLIVSKYSVKILKEKIIIKKSFQLLQLLILKLKIRCKSFIPQISALCKWGLSSPNFFLKKYCSKVLFKIIPILYSFNEKILISYFGVNLVNNLDEKNSIILKNYLRSLLQIILIFPKDYCVPPVRIVFSNLIPLIKNRNTDVNSTLIRLLFIIIDKKWIYIPKKELILLCFNLIKIQKNLNLKNRKLSMQIICKISRIHGPQEVVSFLINSLEKIDGIFRISVIVTLTSIAYENNLHLVLPAFYEKYFKACLPSNPLLYKSLIYILEYIEYDRLFYYINSLGTLIEKEISSEKSTRQPLLVLLIGKFSQKFTFSGFEKKLVFLFKYVLSSILTSPKSVLKYLFFTFEKLLSILDPLIWVEFIFRGLIYPKKKLRLLYWKFKELLNYNKNLLFFILKFSLNSKKNLYRDINFFF